MMNIAEIVREYPTATFVCMECGDAYRWDSVDYCDNSMDCTAARLFDVVANTVVCNSNCWCDTCESN